jgi:hypothetical protein
VLFGVLEKYPNCIIHDKKLHAILPLLSAINRFLQRRQMPSEILAVRSSCAVGVRPLI